MLLDDIILDSHVPISQSAMSDIYKGSLGPREVAVKALRVHVTDFERVQKVSGSSEYQKRPLLTIVDLRNI